MSTCKAMRQPQEKPGGSRGLGQRAVLALGLFLALACSALAGQEPQRVGGACDYAAFPGKAIFMQVAPAPPGEMMDTPYPPMKATFRFVPDAPLAPQGIYEEGRIMTLTLANGALPGKAFLEKYDVRPGASVPCEFMVISKGTCTPTLFRFPKIDTADYFEWEK